MLELRRGYPKVGNQQGVSPILALLLFPSVSVFLEPDLFLLSSLLFLWLSPEMRPSTSDPLGGGQPLLQESRGGRQGGRRRVGELQGRLEAVRFRSQGLECEGLRGLFYLEERGGDLDLDLGSWVGNENERRRTKTRRERGRGEAREREGNRARVCRGKIETQRYKKKKVRS